MGVTQTLPGKFRPIFSLKPTNLSLTNSVCLNMPEKLKYVYLYQGNDMHME